MEQTIILRLAKTEQYDPHAKTILWKDDTKTKWENTYSKLNPNDNGIFLSKGDLYIGKLKRIDIGIALLFEEIKKFTISNDNFLRLNSVTPENISTSKANFHPFITSDIIDISSLVDEIENKKFLSFYIFDDSSDPKIFQKLGLKENDRAVRVYKNELKFLQQYHDGGLRTFKNFKKDLFGAKDYSFEELRKLHEQNEKSNNIAAIDRMIESITSKGYYKFNSFAEYYNIIHNKRLYRGMNDENEIETNDNEQTSETMCQNKPLNTILYGPPGTGKTYSTIQKALEIIDEVDEKKLKWSNRNDVTNLFKKRMEEGRIIFTTFHQSLSYEDFIEGIKPVYAEESAVDNTDSTQTLSGIGSESEKSIQYRIEAGIFKKLCDAARIIKTSKHSVKWQSANYYKMSLGGKGRPDIHDWCIKHNVIGLGWGGRQSLESLSKINNWTEYRDQFIKRFPALVETSRFNIQAAYAFQNIEVGDVVVISKGNRVIDAIGIVKGPYKWDDKNSFDYFHFREVEWIVTDLNVSPERFFKKQISQMAIYQFDKEDVKIEAFEEITIEGETKPKPYVLIIDEINRGNVSQIFGELITLIEPDKRVGKEEELKVILPYSKEKFSVPNNVYIIGTMNTADRSVEALDTALRRRFSFEEINPNPDLLTASSLYGRLWADNPVGWGNKWKALENEFFNLYGGVRTAPENEYRQLEKINWDKWDEAITSGKYVTFSGFELNQMLIKINERIEVLLSRDHQIGHSYFMKVYSWNDLKETLYKNIIPLLQEYFYGDYGKIGLVLGKGFVREKYNETKLKVNFASFDYEDREDLQKTVYELIPFKEVDIQKAIEQLL